MQGPARGTSADHPGNTEEIALRVGAALARHLLACGPMTERYTEDELSQEYVDVHDACTAVGELPDHVLDAMRRAERSSERPTLPAPDDTSYAFVPADSEVIYESTPTPVPLIASEPPSHAFELATQHVVVAMPAESSSRAMVRERARAVATAIAFCVSVYLCVVAIWVSARLLLGW
jgi:hypothetical protein